MRGKYRIRKGLWYFVNVILPILLIFVGVILILAATPPWFWFFILGISLIAVGIIILKK
ncbi:MAG TPA: hypothetical protein PK830_01665 [Candidatus Atribacteria bacterium]|nr:hypothetical protein [Candidatus Atribacteria bacterium]HPT77799.1 hypothetical protein [Candidatus Atribacteria bacterium]